MCQNMSATGGGVKYYASQPGDFKHKSAEKLFCKISIELPVRERQDKFLCGKRLQMPPEHFSMREAVTNAM